MVPDIRERGTRATAAVELREDVTYHCGLGGCIFR